MAQADETDSDTTRRLKRNPHNWPDWPGRPSWAWAFLDVLTLSPNVANAAKAAGVVRQTPYVVRKLQPEFGVCWNQALDESIERLEAEAHRRAFEGYDEPVFYKGDEVGAVRKYSDVLAIFLLKAHRPERYRDRYDVKAGGSLVLDISFPDRPGREAAKDTARQVGEMLSEPDDSGKS